MFFSSSQPVNVPQKKMYEQKMNVKYEINLKNCGEVKKKLNYQICCYFYFNSINISFYKLFLNQLFFPFHPV